MNTELDRSYDYCVKVTRARARNFYFGISLLPPEKRRAMCAIYAFMRSCDDIADDAPAETRAGQLAALRRTLDGASDGLCECNQLLPAFRDAVARHEIPVSLFHDLLDGAEMDQRVERYPTFEALYDYCYHVASVVGLVTIHVFGFQSDAARKHAEHCGIAFQLTNILRDLREDAENGRIYLPQEDLARFGYTEEDIRRQVRDERFRALMKFEAARARDYYRKAEPLMPLISPDSRVCLAAMMGIYEGLLDRIEANGYDVYSARVRLSTPAKVGVMARAWRRYGGRRGRLPSKA